MRTSRRQSLGQRRARPAEAAVAAACDPAPEEPPQAQGRFFVHIQKTGGSSLIHRVRRSFTAPEVYPSEREVGDVDAAITLPYLQRRWQLGHGTIRVVAGHFPLCTADLLGGGFSTLTLLREPVERTLSFLRHYAKTTPSDRDLTPEEIYDDPFRFHGLIHNHAVKMLSMTTAEMTAGALTLVDFTPAHLRRAQANLAAMSVVGLQERFESFCAELTSRFGWRLGDPVYRNQTEPSSVPKAFRRRIAEDNAMDLELYEFGRTIVAQRSS